MHRLHKHSSANVLDTAHSLSFSCKLPQRSHRGLTAKEILEQIKPITIHESDDHESEIGRFIFI